MRKKRERQAYITLTDPLFPCATLSSIKHISFFPQNLTEITAMMKVLKVFGFFRKLQIKTQTRTNFALLPFTVPKTLVFVIH